MKKIGTYTWSEVDIAPHRTDKVLLGACWTQFKGFLHMPPLSLQIDFQQCIFNLKANQVFRISLDRSNGIERNDNKTGIRLRLSFSKRTAINFIFAEGFGCQ